MSLPKEIWEMARTIWEHTPEISLDELVEQLEDVFGQSPNKSSISRKIKSDGWAKIKTQQTKCNKPIERDKATKGLVVIENATKRIEEKLDSLVLDTEQKKQIILKHRKRIRQLGDLQESTMQTMQGLHDTPFADDDDNNELKAKIIIMDKCSGTLDKLVGVQKILFEQEMIISGITMDDFKQSEQERRMQSLAMLENIHEEEALARKVKNAELLDRLREFESHSIDELNVVEGVVLSDTDDELDDEPSNDFGAEQDEWGE